MGLLDNLENQALGSVLGGGSNNAMVSSILSMIQNQPGGLQGIVQSFHDKGLGGLVSAWVSTGPNPPATGDQIQQALGSDKVKQIAAAAGISPDIANSAIAQLLPTIIDKLTPNGQVPEHGNVISMMSGLLQSLTQQKAS
jgi:uncharacterized protein YidB (DUF937 family)